MNKLKYSFSAKIISVFFYLLFTLILIFGTLCSIFLYTRGFYYRNIDDLKVSFYEDITNNYSQKVVEAVFSAHNGDDITFDEITNLNLENTNYKCIVKFEGEKIYSTYNNENYCYRSLPRTFTFTTSSGIAEYEIESFVISPISAKDDYSRSDYWVNLAYEFKYLIIAVTVFSLIASVFIFILIMYTAGRKKGSDDIYFSGIDKIPYDIFIGLFVLLTYIELNIFDVFYLNILFYIIYIAVLSVDILLLLVFCHSTAVRYKGRSLIKNTVIYRFLKHIYFITKKVFQIIYFMFLKLNLYWKLFVIFSVISSVEFFVFVIDNLNSGTLFVWLLIKIISASLLFVAAINLQTIKRGGENIAKGNSEYKVDTSFMFPFFKEQGETLNSINQVVTISVDEKLKSERMKTELITNVSHDIKTPLTSIVNYVTLLKKENLEGKCVNEYLDVLVRQSKRMKKLIEDLVDVSKATTGNMPVSLIETDINVLTDQACGEYLEKMAECGLELVVNIPDEKILVLADGRLLWRVYENLLNNICKYTLSGTRVFLTIESANDKVIITFKNISKFPLNIPKKELLERFVRGDVSRSTEGSGLGLSIAQSLIELQKGSFDIFIDGDLFKATVIFDKITEK